MASACSSGAGTWSPDTTPCGRMSVAPCPTDGHRPHERRAADGARILDLARVRAPTIEFRGRYTGGTGEALDRLATGAARCRARTDRLAGRPTDPDDRPSPVPPGAAGGAAARRTSLGTAGGGAGPESQGARDRWTAVASGDTGVGRPDRPVLRPVRSPLDAAASARHRTPGAGVSPGAAGRPDPRVGGPCGGAGWRSPSPRRSDPALRVVDGVATGDDSEGLATLRAAAAELAAPKGGSPGRGPGTTPGCPSRTRRASRTATSGS